MNVLVEGERQSSAALAEVPMHDGAVLVSL